MKVRSSTRATSFGSEKARKEFGRFFGSSRMNVPLATICSQSASYSGWAPSHQWTRSGRVSRAISWTQAIRRAFLTQVGAVASSGDAVAVIWSP
jgi:hypothetical protein